LEAETVAINTVTRDDKIQAILDRLEERDRERISLMDQLRRSLAIEAAWPGVFEHGSVRTRWAGSPSRGWRFKILAGDGSERTWEETDAPEFALPAPRYVGGRVIYGDQEEIVR
jgi:hypothetical protein